MTDEWADEVGTAFTNPKRRPRLYLAGPMTGIPFFNFPAFDEAADRLRAAGYEVCNPADHDRATYGPDVASSPTGNPMEAAAKGFDLREALAWDLTWIAQNAEGIALLDGWENSKGASAEVALGHALHLDVASVESFIRAPLVAPIELPAPSSASGEVRTTSSTGGQKGVKPQRFDLIPPVPLTRLSELYGNGAAKYADHNWAKGYEWSKSFGALMRHAWQFWNGEDIDDEMGLPHMTAVAWHAFSLVHFLENPEKYAQFDNRPRIGDPS